MTVKTNIRNQSTYSQTGKLFLTTLLALSQQLLSAEVPIDNPVAGYYGEGGYATWTDSIRWDNVIDMSTYANGTDNFSKFENARDELYSAGGGVLYYPEGTYPFDFPDTGYGNGIGPGSRGLMLKSGVVIRGADLLPGEDEAVIRPSTDVTAKGYYDNVTYSLNPKTVFVFSTQLRGKDPLTDTPDSAGEVPRDWNFIGMTTGEGETDIGEINNVGVVNVKLDGGFVFFGFHTNRSATLDSGTWFSSQWKSNWPAGAPLEETWAKRVPDGTHYMDCLHGSFTWHEPISAGSGRLIFGVLSINGAPYDDMTNLDGKSTAQTQLPANAFHSYRYTGRFVAHGENILIANNVLAKPTKNFVHKMIQGPKYGGTSIGEKLVLFDYSYFIGIDVNKSNYGGHQDSPTVTGPNSGYAYPNVIVSDNWVFNRGDKGFELAGKWLIAQNNHNERYYAGNSFPYEYISNPEAYPSATPESGINAGGISFEGWRWQSDESNDDYLSRGYDLGGRNIWIDGNSVINTGSRGNDGEGIMAQSHNNIVANSWAFTHNVQNNVNKGTGTFGEPGWIGLWDMHAIGFLVFGNAGTGTNGILAAVGNPVVDVTIGPNLGSGPNSSPASTYAAPYNNDYQVVHADPVSAPVDVAVIFGENGEGAHVSWLDTADNELGFRVERRIGAGEWKVISYRPRQGLGKGSGLVSKYDSTTGYPDLNPEVWVDYTASKSMNPEYRIIAFNNDNNDSTGVSESAFAPADPEAPVVMVLVEGSNFKIRFTSVTGFKYQLQSSDDMKIWQDLGAPKDGTGDVLEFSQITPTVESAKFYQILVSL